MGWIKIEKIAPVIHHIVNTVAASWISIQIGSLGAVCQGVERSNRNRVSRLIGHKPVNLPATQQSVGCFVHVVSESLSVTDGQLIAPSENNSLRGVASSHRMFTLQIGSVLNRRVIAQPSVKTIRGVVCQMGVRVATDKIQPL